MVHPYYIETKGKNQPKTSFWIFQVQVAETKSAIIKIQRFCMKLDT